MHCDPKWDQPQDITLAGMFFVIGRSLGDASATKAVNQLFQKTQPDQQQQMVCAKHLADGSYVLTSALQFHLAEAWAARLIQPVEAEHQQVQHFDIYFFIFCLVIAICAGGFCHDCCAGVLAETMTN